MKRGTQKIVTCISVDNLEEGVSMEEKMRIVTSTNEPIDNVAPLIFTEEKDGILPEFDIRTDRFEIAQEAMDKVTKSYVAKREELASKAQSKEQE